MKIPVFALAAVLAVPAAAQQLSPADQQLARDIFRELVETNTTDSVGSVTAAAKEMQRRLLDAGFAPQDAQLLGPNERKMNLVARYRGKAGSTLKPVLVICHLDVVEAKREDWTVDPFKFTEKDGYFYGRGTIDVKDGDAAAIFSFLKMKREGFVPDRDIVLALTADEEGGSSNGVDWLIQNHRDLLDAEFVINPDAGSMTTVDGKPFTFDVEASEKTYADYVASATSPGGHSSEPMPGNPIYRVANALARLEKYKFPFELNEVTRSYFSQQAMMRTGQAAEDMKAILKPQPDEAAIARLDADYSLYPQLHTTCVATMISGGHAPNALPGKAEANINCRILPGHTQEEVRKQLLGVLNDPELKLQYKSDAGVVTDTAPDRASAPPPPPNPAVFVPLKKVVNEMWPGEPIVTGMVAGASDSIYTTAAGMPSYGISGMAMDREENRAHGRDERIKVEDFYAGTEFFYRYLKALTTK